MKVTSHLVRLVRSYYGENAEEFAFRLGVSPDTIKKVENDNKTANGIVKARILSRCDLTTF